MTMDKAISPLPAARVAPPLAWMSPLRLRRDVA